MSNVVSITSNQMTMSSLEIAELTGKEHKNILRDCRNMFSELKIDQLKFERISKDSANRDRKEYQLPKDLTLTLLTGYSIPMRHKVNQRWLELETKQEVQAIDFNDPSKLRGYLLQATEEIEKRNQKILYLEPKAEALDLLATADGSLCITDAAKDLQVRPKSLFGFLQRSKWIYKRTGNSHWVAYQDKLLQGLMEHKTTTVSRSDGTEKITEQVRVTPKGLTKLARLVSRGDVA